MREARILRIVVASPGDVQAERDLLPGIIDELNRGVAADQGLRYWPANIDYAEVKYL